MAFASQNVLYLVFVCISATAQADSYIVDKETDEMLVIATGFFFALAVVLLVLSIYFVWKLKKRGWLGDSPFKFKSCTGRKVPWRKKSYKLSVKEKHGLDQAQNEDPFRKYGKYSQKSNIYNNIYLPGYETVLASNTGTPKREDNLYLSTMTTFSSSTPLDGEDDHDYECVDATVNPRKENGGSALEVEKRQRDAQTSEKDHTIAMTTVITSEIAHENSAYDNE